MLIWWCPLAARAVFRRATRQLHSAIPLGGPLAQLVEHRTFNPGVAGSNPAWLTSYLWVWVSG